MKYVPKYLLPRIAPVSSSEEAGAMVQPAVEQNKEVGFVPFRKDAGRGRGRGRGRGKSMRGGRKKADPLKKFGR
jgi:ATP-dependent RNA helicase DDX56/DBP9